MKAVILAAGYGDRMRPLTDAKHKTLLEVGGRTIIDRIVDGLVSVGVQRIVVVTGYRADEVEGHLLQRSDAEIEFVRNERYHETNNIFSMALAFERMTLDDDLILVEGDLVCDGAVFERLVRSPHPNVALVDRYRTGMDGTVVTVEGGVVTSVIPPHLQSGTFSFADKYKTLNIYRFSREFCRSAFKRLLSAYAAIDESCYYELVLGILIYLKKETIFAEIIDGERWAELDDPNDLRIAEFAFGAGEQRRILDAAAGGYWSYDITDFCFIRNMHFPTPSMMAEILHNLPSLLHNYGSKQEVLNGKLAVFLRCASDRVLALNGVSQIYPLLATRLVGARVLLPEPTFGEYRRSFPDHAAYPDRIGVDLALVERQAESADVVVFVNPNNPTGTDGIDYAKGLIEAARAALPGCRLDVGEAVSIDPREPYDIVLSSGVFIYFSDLGYAEEVLVKMIEKASRGVAVLDVSDAARREEALALRRASYAEGEYDRAYAGLEHLYFERSWFEAIAAARGLSCRIEPQSLPNYVSSEYRFNVFLTRQ